MLTHHRAVWRSCLASALRTALACTIVGGITLFGPTSLRQQVAFPAFSYVTVILIVTDATLGDTLRGCWYAVYATVQAVCPAVLTLWAIGPARLTASTTSALVAVTAFVVVLPEKTHLVAKRIALGQTVIVYVIAYINGGRTEPVMHPIHVAASTAVGVAACVLALLLPYPSLAFCEVKEKCKLYAENASERVNVLLKAFFSSENKASAISQSKSMAITSTKLLNTIKSKQEIMRWEILPIMKFMKPILKPWEKLQEIETPLKGLEIALSFSSSSSSPFPVEIHALKDHINGVQQQINLRLNQFKTYKPLDFSTIPESNSENPVESLQTLQFLDPTQKNLPVFFFLFCLKLFLNNPAVNSDSGGREDEQRDSQKKEPSVFGNISFKRLTPAFKASISLGLAVLLGSIYSKGNGFWSGLPVAIGLASGSEATFRISNVKAQGTVLGTVYGVLGCFVFERFVRVRILSLLPWFVFSSFLRRSRMYGQAGGISAVIGAVLILGRNNFGPPSEFAIARITETFIGLSCSIMVEIMFQPTRASTLARTQLSDTLRVLRESVDSVSLRAAAANSKEWQNRVQIQVNQLKKLVGEAEAEPNFWFTPFHSHSYSKLTESLSKMADFLIFAGRAIEFLEQQSQKIEGTLWKNKLDSELQIMKQTIISSINCFKEALGIKSLAILEISDDLEMGKTPNPAPEEDQTEKIMDSYIERLRDEIEKIEGREEAKGELVLSLGALGFCMGGLMKETKEVEKGIKDILQWENPSSHVDLHEISCKIRALHKL